MLVIKVSEQEEVITIGDDINIKVNKLNNGDINIAIKAPKELKIKREK